MGLVLKQLFEIKDGKAFRRFFYPEGAKEDSPGFQSWVSFVPKDRALKGRKTSCIPPGSTIQNAQSPVPAKEPVAQIKNTDFFDKIKDQNTRAALRSSIVEQISGYHFDTARFELICATRSKAGC